MAKLILNHDFSIFWLELKRGSSANCPLVSTEIYYFIVKLYLQ